MKTKVLKCVCESEFQDKEYGPGKRLHNLGVKDTSGVPARCTVCGREHRITQGKAEEK